MPLWKSYRASTLPGRGAYTPNVGSPLSAQWGLTGAGVYVSLKSRRAAAALVLAATCQPFLEQHDRPAQPSPQLLFHVAYPGEWERQVLNK